jgi:hypothetical protein
VDGKARYFFLRGVDAGSVRAGVLASVSSETLEALATIAGGDTPGDDF